MKSVFALGILYVLIQGAFCAKKLNITFTSWEGTNCANYGEPAPSGCTTDKLTPYVSSVSTFKEGDNLCIDLPADPKNILWSHSATSQPSDATLPWDQRINNLCQKNSTGTYLKSTVYTGRNCVAANKMMDAVTPIGNIMTMWRSPLGNFNYTEIVNCVVYDGASHIATNLFLVLAIIFFLF